MDFSRNISDKIRKIRKDQSLTQHEFAEMIGISGGYLSEIEVGKKKPTIELINFIITEYKISPNELFGYGQAEAEVSNPSELQKLIAEEVEKALERKMESMRFTIQPVIS